MNLFRAVFRVPALETILRKKVHGKSINNFYAKLAPNPYQYPANSLRTIVINGIRLTLDISDYLSHSLYFGFEGQEWRSYEKLFSLASKGDNILDIGSNIGFTLLNLRKISESGRVIGFEPDKTNYQHCLRNLNQNNFQDIQLFNFGLGKAKALLPMEVRSEMNRGGNRVAVNGEGELIQIDTLDSFFPSLDLEKVDLVKIDVEGYELNVLEGGIQTLRRYYPTLFIEVSDQNLRDQNASAKSLIQFLYSIGYNKFIKAETGEEITAVYNFLDCHFDIVAKRVQL